MNHPDLASLAGEKDMDMADIDGDGDLDIVIAMKDAVSGPAFNGLRNLLLLNDGGSFVDFTDKTDFASGLNVSASRDVEIFDADGDGWLDVVFANTGIAGVSPSTAPSQPRLYRNKGVNQAGVWQGLEEVPRSTWLEFHHYSAPFPTGQLLGVLSYMDPAPRFCGVASGDVDKDGLDDLFFVDYENDLGHRYLVNESTPGNFRFVDRTDEPNGVLQPLTNLELSESDIGRKATGSVNFTTGVEMEDLNNDGWLELVYFTDSLSGGAKIMFTKNGRFQALEKRFIGGIYSGGLLDFNQDGRLDVYMGSDSCDGIMANHEYSGQGGEPTFFLGWDDPQDPGAGIAEDFLTSAVAGCVNSADLDRDGLPDVGVGDIDVSDDVCGTASEPRFHILLNTTPDPAAGQEFADPDACALAVHGRTGTMVPSFPCKVTYSSVQPWNVNGVFDFEFIDLNKDGFQDMIMGTCAGFEFWTMDGFESALNYCDALPNSTGLTAKIGWVGSLSLGTNNFSLTVEGATAGQTAQFFYGPAQVEVPFGDGLRCVGGSLQRLATFSLDGQGSGAQQLDFTLPPANSGSGQVLANQSVNFQCFFRDSASSGAGFNYSDALSVYFVQ